MFSAQLPLLAVAAACCLSLARAADELSAAPVDVLLSVEFCATAADCRWAGDAQATCSATKTCACSTNSGDFCHVGQAAPPASATTRMNIALTLRDATCDRTQIDALVADVKARLVAAGIINPTVVGVCGSVTLVVDADLPTATLGASVDSAASAVREGAIANSNFTKLTSGDDVVVGVSPAQTSSGLAVCDTRAVSTIVAYDGRCVVLECATGSTLVTVTVDGKDRMTCEVPRSVPAGDDDLSGGGIAAIVIGCVAVVGGVVAVLLYMCLQKRNDVPEAAKNEPIENDIQV